MCLQRCVINRVEKQGAIVLKFPLGIIGTTAYKGQGNNNYHIHHYHKNNNSYRL